MPSERYIDVDDPWEKILELNAEVERLRTALDGLITVAAGLARHGDMVDKYLAGGAIAAAKEALGERVR